MASAHIGKRAAATVFDFLLFFAPYVIGASETAPDAVRTAAAFASVGVLVAQAALLSRDGQTFGKKIWGLRVVRRDTGENGGFVTNVLIRATVAWIPNLFLAAFGSPPMWLLADGLTLAWRDDGLSLHDLAAGTAVVEIPS
ncbi:MAG: RDD family protein [Elusimicrobia bacterium]|nr:RDD family protein [Elusimicrobiota bacterium]